MKKEKSRQRELGQKEKCNLLPLLAWLMCITFLFLPLRIEIKELKVH